ncbi:putative F-box domain-containing protein [Rosa chinensis]|uniref:Putative F-box domain-containing protein n=1 Tax=Rosa chinensis TaxID=74649 RepID=A0A2P6RLH7_ROSCH|nr:putative F-box protein At1g65770 isoform X3 [Rosa chinensis]PRQ47289.1 putative F-box domain-containing protein [Rosa chinensis]
MDTVKWSDLPKELWPIIGKFLHSRIDVLRFRSVCSLWRSSRPPFQRPLPPPPLPLTFSPPGAGNPKNQALLFQSTTYRMESIIDKRRSGSSRSKPWLMKLEQDPNSGRMRLVHPVTGLPLRYSPNATSKDFSLLEFRVVELRKSYVLKFGKNNVTVKSVQRLVVMPCDFLDIDDVFGVFMVYNEGKLGFVRFGDEKLTRVDEQNAHYDDIIVYKGQCYVVDKWGTISWVNSALQVIQFSPPLCGFGGRKYLVECRDDLYVVDQFFEKVTQQSNIVGTPFLDNELLWWHYHKMRSDAESIDFKAYKLDQEWGKWVDVKDMGDDIFILSNDGSFSVSAKEFAGVKGNCIFFTESALTTGRLYPCVFNLEDGLFSKASLRCPQMVHPPSSWLSPD